MSPQVRHKLPLEMGTRLNSNSLQNEASNISQATHPLCQPCRPKVVLSNFANIHQPQGIPKPQSHVPHLSTGHTRRVCPTQALALTSLAGKSLGEAENQGKLLKLVRSSWLSQPWWPMAIMAYRPCRQETAINEASHPEVASRRTTRCDFGKMSWPWWKKHHLGIETGTVVSKLVIEAAKTDLSSMPRWLACCWLTNTLWHFEFLQAQCGREDNILLIWCRQMPQSKNEWTFHGVCKCSPLSQIWGSCADALGTARVCSNMSSSVVFKAFQGKVVKFQLDNVKRWQCSRNLLIQPTAHRQGCWLMSH